MKTHSFSALLTALFWTAVFAGAAEPEKPLPAGKPLLPPDALRLAKQNVGKKPFAEMKFVEVKGQPFKEAVQVQVLERPETRWGVQINLPLTNAASWGDVVLISLQARTLVSESPEGKGMISVFFGVPSAGLPALFSKELKLGAQWTKVQIPVRLATDCEPGRTVLNLDLGFEPQILEIADIRITNFGSKVSENDLPKSGF